MEFRMKLMMFVDSQRNSRERQMIDHVAVTPNPSLHLPKQVCPLLRPSTGEPKPWTSGWNGLPARMLRLTRRSPPWVGGAMARVHDSSGVGRRRWAKQYSIFNNQ